MPQPKPQARGLDTRRRLRDAVVDTIIEVGLPKASTPKINEKAGVSNGAQQYHYPTRSELVIDSLEQLTAEYATQLDDHMDDVLQGGTVIDVLRLMGSTSDEHLRYRLCCIEAMVASRTCRELGEAMRPLDLAKTKRVKDAAIRLASGNEDQVADVVELTTFLVRGMALQRSLHPDANYDRLLDVWCSIVDSVLAVD